MLNLRLIEYRNIQLLLKKYFQYVYLPFEANFFIVLKIPLMAEHLLKNSLPEKYFKLATVVVEMVVIMKVIKHPQSRKPSVQLCL